MADDTDTDTDTTTDSTTDTTTTDTTTDTASDSKKSWLAKLGVTQFSGGSSDDDSSNADGGGGQSTAPSSTTQSVWDAASSAVQTVSDAASTVVQDVSDAASTVVQDVSDAGSVAVQAVSDAANSAADDLGGGAADAATNSSSAAVANLVGAAPDGGGFNLEIEVPLAKREIELSDKIKGEAEGTANGKAKVDGGGAATVTLDKNGWGVKVTESIWNSKAKAELGGVDLFANPKLEEESAANANERSFKVSFSAETPLGKLAIAAIPFKISGTDSRLGAIEGSLEGKPAQFGEAEVEGVKFSDIELCFTFKFTVSPDWAKIVAEQLRKRALNAAEDAAGDAAMDIAIDGGLIFVAIGVIAGTANELSKAADARTLISQVGYCYNRFTDGLHTGLTGTPNAPGDPWGDAGWKPGNKMYTDAVNKALAANPDGVIDEIQAQVANKAQKIAGSMDGSIKTKIGDQFWTRWVANNHGLGTFLGDAKDACAACYQEAMVAENDPRLDAWKKVSSLPEFLK